MLVVKIKEHDQIVITPGIYITWERDEKSILVNIQDFIKITLEIDRGVLRAAVDAPKEIRVHREPRDTQE